MGIVGFAFSLISTSLHDVVRPGGSVILGHPIANWTPSAVLHAAIFYLNRLLEKKAQAFSFAATTLLILIVGVESPMGYSGLLWMCLGGVLFELGWRKHLVTPAWFVMGCVCLVLGRTSRTPSFRWLAQGILFCAFCRCAIVDLVNGHYRYLPYGQLRH
jgi:hypothetical protein